jgi:1-acyl-sn-glycerol-3-phosphate acyltransferase
MSKQLLTNDYTTDKNHPRSLGDRLALGTSFRFYFGFVKLLLNNRRVALAGNFDTATWASSSMDIFEWTEKCGGKYHIKGLDNIDKIDGPVVFVCNHQSILETMIFPGILASRREVTFVVKSSLPDHWLFGPIMRVRNPITVERKDPIADFKKVMSEGADFLAKGTSVVVFPQSKRIMGFDPKEFNTLGMKLAKSANVPVVPMAIKTDFWQNGTFVKDVGSLKRSLPIHIEFGEPIHIDGPGKKEHQEVLDFISSRMKVWEEELR